MPLTEFHEKIPPTPTLPYRQGHNTTDIKILRAPLLFAEITHKPRPNVVGFSHHVEQEWFDVIEQRLVIEKHFRQQAQVLAVNLWGESELFDICYARVTRGTPCSVSHPLQISIHFHLCKFRLREDDGLCTSAVLSLSTPPVTTVKVNTYPMSRGTKPTLIILKAKFTDPQTSIGNIRILLRERCIIPGVNIIFPKTDCTYPEPSQLRDGWRRSRCRRCGRGGARQIWCLCCSYGHSGSKGSARWASYRGVWTWGIGL